MAHLFRTQLSAFATLDPSPAHRGLSDLDLFVALMAFLILTVFSRVVTLYSSDFVQGRNVKYEAEYILQCSI